MGAIFKARSKMPSVQLSIRSPSVHLPEPSTCTFPVSISPEVVDGERVPDYVMKQHTRLVGSNQCYSALTQSISAPVETVWSVVRRFDHPHAYKRFLKSCHIVHGDGDVGTIRLVHVVSGIPAASSFERLDILDDENHVMGFMVIGGDHRLSNYRSVISLHANEAGGTVVVESYVVDVPPGNTHDDTCTFADTIVRCNLLSLARLAGKMAVSGNTTEA